MISLRKLTHEDYEDVVEICKDIWEGTDYLPSLFHGWVDDKTGLFIGAVDTETNKVIGTDKYTVFPDGTAWLEGMRLHQAYRGRKIAKLLTEHLIEHAKQELQAGKVAKIAFSTHISSVESINMMKKYHFQIEQQHLMVGKTFDKLNPDVMLEDFEVKPWNATYEEFENLPFTLRRNGIFHIAFIFQKPTMAFFNYLKEHDCFVEINGYKGIYLFKGEPHFVTQIESFEAIDTFMNYYLVSLKDQNGPSPLFSVMPEDTALIERLKAANYSNWADWQCDYFYFVLK